MLKMFKYEGKKIIQRIVIGNYKREQIYLKGKIEIFKDEKKLLKYNVMNRLNSRLDLLEERLIDWKIILRKLFKMYQMKKNKYKIWRKS